ncbi:MAG: T9SS type A sorting domain-containing protein [Carboxylicivirga sp.]|nr:T9SS type A sorting domain-containing protein [Carboxylicivirga sp.]
MMKHLLIAIFLLSSLFCSGQISHGGSPIEFGGKPAALELDLPAHSMSAFKAYEEPNKLPLRFAEPIFTTLTPQNSGQWTKIGDKNVWRLVIKSKGAKSINLIFDRFRLKHGDKLFAYNPDKTHVLGAFTNKNNNASQLFSIAPVLGDELILELQTTYSPSDEHEILISAVNHDYLGVVNYLKRSIDFNDSGSCNVNVKCGEYNSEEINRSVCKIIVDGSMLCSGTLLNNTFGNGRPYFLTAAHCFEETDVSSGYISAQNIIFYFNFESPECEPTTMGVVNQTISGADVLAIVKNIDFALLEMNKMPPVEYKPYWAGWKLDEEVPNKVYTVHHPQGDVKKVSVSKNAPISTTFDFHGKFLSDMHWRITEWDSGVTEGGSSGSGLFTQDHYLIGNLSGGEAYCGNPYNDYYTRLNKAWDSNAEDNKQLKVWLDNAGSNVIKQDGVDFYENKEVLSHYNPASDEQVLERLENGKGSYSGHNSLGYTGYAEFFDDYSSAMIGGVYLSPAQVDDSGSGHTFNIKIWDEVDGLPGDMPIGAINNIQLKKISTAKQLFTFEEPVSISGAFFVGVELNYESEPDTLALYQVKPTGKNLTKNTAFIRNAEGWLAYNELHPLAENGSYLIDLLAYKDYVPTDTGEVDKNRYEIIIKPNPVIEGEIRFEMRNIELDKVEVFGLNGSKIKEYVVRNPKNDSFAVRGLPSGIYLLKFSNANTSIVKKVLVIH